VPPHVGIGLRAPHYTDVWDRRPSLALLEVHSENFFGSGGQPLAWLERFRSAYPLSFHGVGLSLGSADPLDERHLESLSALVRRFEPQWVSEHLSWSSIDARHANDLLPLPFTQEAADHLVERIGQLQERLGRRVLVENVSTYMTFEQSTLSEAEFVADVVRRSGCALLLDLNNVWVNSRNHTFDPFRYLDALAPESIQEIHLAGFEAVDDLLIDTHGTRVSNDVWMLYGEAVRRWGARTTVIEWDTDLPSLDVLLQEARKAEAVGV
jgi:uncharacterized protein (UPF0276 family)